MQIHQPSVTGSLAVTGSIIVTGSTTISGSLFNPTIAENNSSDLTTVKVDTSSGAFFFSAGSDTDWYEGPTYLTASKDVYITGSLSVEGPISGAATLTVGNNHSNIGPSSSIAGGEKNKIDSTARHSFIGGGALNTASAQESVIGGGLRNKIENGANNSFIGAGIVNTICGSAANGGILGGYQNILYHGNSFILGKYITSSAEDTTYVDNFHISRSLTDSNGNIGTNGQVLSSNGVDKVQWTNNIASASFALTASYFSGSIESSSYALTSSHAISASYAPSDTDWYQFPGTNNITASGQVDISGSSCILGNVRIGNSSAPRQLYTSDYIVNQNLSTSCFGWQSGFGSNFKILPDNQDGFTICQQGDISYTFHDWYNCTGNKLVSEVQSEFQKAVNISSSLTVTGSTDITGSLSITGPTITTGSLTTTQGDVNFHGCSATALSCNVSTNVFREGANTLYATCAHTSFGGGINDTIKTTGTTRFPYQYCLTECYNGITWSNLSNTSFNGRMFGRATGTTTSALLNGGSRYQSNNNPVTCTEVWNGSTWSAGVDTPYGGQAMSSFGNNSNSINLLGGNCDTTVYNCNIEWNGTSWNVSTALPKNLRGMGAAGTPSAGVVFQGVEYLWTGYNNNYINWNGVSWNTGVSRPQSTQGGAAYGGTATSAWTFGTEGNGFCTAVYDGTSYYEDTSYSGLSDWCIGSGTGPSGTNGLGISGVQNIGVSRTWEYTSGESSAVHFDNATSQLVFTAVSASGHYVDDAAAAAGGVPLGGIYRNGNFIAIRLT